MIKILSHHDLDGITCIINIWNAIKDKSKFQYRLTGYNNLDKALTGLLRDHTDLLWITDINFNKEQMNKLTKVNNNVKVIYIDHHTYDYDVMETIKGNKNIHARVNEKACGCLNTFLFLSNLYSKNDKAFWNENKLKLVELNKVVDTYDRWQKDHPYFFKKSIPLNDLFWEYGYEKFFLKFRDGYTIGDEELEVIEKKANERKTYLEKAFNEYSVDSKDTKSLFILNPNPKFSNDFTLYYPDYEFYVIMKESIDDLYHFSIRINEHNNSTIRGLITELEKKGVEVAAGGHAKSGGMAVKKDNIDLFLKTINEVFGEQLHAG